MSQQLLGYIRDLNVRVDALTQAFEALAADVRELKRNPAVDPETLQAAANAHVRTAISGMVKRGPGRPPKQAAPDGNGA